MKRSVGTFILLGAFVCTFRVAESGASCCMTKAVGLRVPDPYARRPSDWDEEDDGPWFPADVEVTSIRGWWRWKYEMRDLIRSNSGWLLAGLLAAGILRGLKPSSSTIGALLGARASSEPTTIATIVKHAFMGAGIGLLLPCCSCGVIPLAASVIEGGASLSGALAMTFVASGSGLDSAPFTAGTFGYTAAVVRLLVVAFLGIIFSVTASIVGRFTMTSKIASQSSSGGQKTMRCSVNNECCTSSEAEDTSGGTYVGASARARSVAAVEGVFMAAEEVLVSIALGVAFTAASTAWGWGEGWLAGSEEEAVAGGDSSSSSSSSGAVVLRRLGFLGASLPLQMCEHAVVTLAKGLVASGVASPGAAAAWVVLSPATSAGLFSLVAKHLGGAAAGASAAVAVLASFAVAEIVDHFLASSSLLTIVTAKASVLSRPPDLPAWFASGSMPVLAVMAVFLVIRRFLYFIFPLVPSSCSPSNRESRYGDDEAKKKK